MFTLGKAAKETGLSKPTISKAIKKGRLSATRNEQGGYQIDPAELFRVYPPSSETAGKDLQEETPVSIEGLRREILLLQEERERERGHLQATIDDLRRRLDAEAEERRKLTALLTDQRTKAQPEPTPRKRSWFGWR